MNIAIAGLIKEAGFNRWKGQDMQVRPYIMKSRESIE